MTDPVLDARNLGVNYGPVKALDGASLTIHPGRICGVVGMNGSGKSTFFKAVMGLVPHSGETFIAGVSISKARKRGLVGYVPQSEDIDHNFPLSVEDVVMTGRYGFMGFTRRPRREDREATRHALARVGLSELSKRPIGALSGGQRKRVFVARALAQGAKLMLLDEPFAGVDITSQDIIIKLLRELAAEGPAMLVSTHDLDSLDTLCDEVVLLNRTILFHGDVKSALEPTRLRQAYEDR